MPISGLSSGLIQRNPITGEQLVRHQTARETTNARGDRVTTMEHRAGWDATFSAPKSVSLTALVGGDERVQAHRESVRVALNELEPYVQARGGNRRPETTGNAAAALFEHDSARPVNGYAALQRPHHAVIFNVTETADGACSRESCAARHSRALGGCRPALTRMTGQVILLLWHSRKSGQRRLPWIPRTTGCFRPPRVSAVCHGPSSSVSSWPSCLNSTVVIRSHEARESFVI